jgi:hypothetical protein
MWRGNAIFTPLICNQIFPPDSIRQLRLHLASHNLSLCEVCLTERKIFLSEVKAYSPSEFEQHNQVGDLETGSKGHPLCFLCDKRFYDNEKLAAHLNNDHSPCFICRERLDPSSSLAILSSTNDLSRSEGNSMQSSEAKDQGREGSYFFRNVHELNDHFKRCHHLCKTCKKLRVVSVFRSESDLQEHIARSHSQMGNTSALHRRIG